MDVDDVLDAIPEIALALPDGRRRLRQRCRSDTATAKNHPFLYRSQIYRVPSRPIQGPRLGKIIALRGCDALVLRPEAGHLQRASPAVDDREATE